jgi:uncharacterized protein
MLQGGARNRAAERPACVALDFSSALAEASALMKAWCSAMSAVFKTFLAMALLWLIGMGCSFADEFYRAQTIVTGTGEANRVEALGPLLEEVLVKVSGVQRLPGDRRLAAFKAKAKDLVGEYSYHDQMSGIPIHDEQGTRDRPYDLTVDFDPAKIADALKQLGLRPWAAPRPTLAVFAGLQQGTNSYVIAADGDRGMDQRDSLLTTAAKRGVPVMLPSADALNKAGVDATRLAKATPASLASALESKSSDVMLIGQLTWNERKLGWDAQWHMDFGGKSHSWRLLAPTYDEAFRRGIGGAAQMLSGNGEPK